MQTIECPICGNKITVRFFIPASIKCKKCQTKFDVEFEDENGNLHPGGWRGFQETHPKIVKALKITGYATFFGLIIAGEAERIKERIESVSDTVEASDSPVNCSDISSSVVSSESLSMPDDTTEYETKITPVRGGLVNLPNNQRPSLQKREEAAANGYLDLGEHQTWRVDYSRERQIPID